MSSTRLPTGRPPSPASQPGITWPAPSTKDWGTLRVQDESNTLPVRHTMPVYCTTTVSPFRIGWPWPRISTCETSFLGGAAFEGTVITGPGEPDLTVGMSGPGWYGITVPPARALTGI